MTLPSKKQGSKFEPWRSEAENATSRSQKLPTVLNVYEWAGRNIFVSNGWYSSMIYLSYYIAAYKKQVIFDLQIKSPQFVHYDSI